MKYHPKDWNLRGINVVNTEPGAGTIPEPGGLPAHPSKRVGRVSLLDAVTEARALRDLALREYARAIVRASEGGHSLRQIAAAAGCAFSVVRYHLLKERGDTKK